MVNTQDRFLLANLYRSNCAEIPDKQGIYYVLAPPDFTVRFLSVSTNPKAPLYSAALLQEKYSGCGEKELLYIGKASGKHGLRQRIRQYVKYGWGEAVNHKGGRAIWQIENAGSLQLSFDLCKHADAREHQLLQAYKVKNGCYPLANWRG